MPRKNSSLSEVLGGVGQLLVFNTQPTCLVISRRLGKNWQSWWIEHEGLQWKLVGNDTVDDPFLDQDKCPTWNMEHADRVWTREDSIGCIRHKTVELCGAGLYETRWTRSGQRHLDFNHFIPHSLCLFLEVMKSMQSKTCWLHFLTHFSTNLVEILYQVGAVQVEHSDAIFEWDLTVLFQIWYECCTQL